MRTELAKLAKALVLAGCTLGLSAAHAGPVTVGGGWVSFTFDVVGTGFSDQPYTFTTATSVLLKVTDAFRPGDQFEIFSSGTSLGLTSVPGLSDDQIFDDYDTAFADPEWSSGSWLLAAGSYSITGIAVLSPFGEGGAALRVDAATVPVPEPTSLALVGLSLAGLALSRRRKAA